MSEPTSNGSASLFVTDGPMSRALQELNALHAALSPLCPCDHNPETTDGPQRECPIHGDGETFVAYVQRLRDQVAALTEERRQLIVGFEALNAALRMAKLASGGA